MTKPPTSRPRRAAPPPPMPAGLANGAEALPVPAMQPFAFGVLLMRVGDGGAVLADMACGYTYGFSQEAAQAEFVTNVQRAYPGHSITKVMAQPVLPLQVPAAEPVPPAAA